MRLPWLSSLLLVQLACSADSSRSYPGGGGARDGTGTSLLVRSAPEEGGPGEWTVFLPAEVYEPGLEDLSAETLRAAGYRLDVVELEDSFESTQGPDSGSEPDGLLMRRPPRRGGPGGPPGTRQPPLLSPRLTPQQRLEAQRRAADLAALQASRDLYHQGLATAKALYPNSRGYQEHHVIPVYLGGARSGKTFRVPTAYHKLLTRAFRKEWGYDKTSPPKPQERLEIMLKVYSQFPIPQLIGINP
jgi:hypothetical protein